MRQVALALVVLGCVVSGCSDAVSGTSEREAGTLTEGGGLLSPSTYRMGVHALEAAPTALVDVPRGWRSGGRWYVVTPDEQAFLGLWTVNGVHPDPCHGRSPALREPGPDVTDLAAALVAQKSTTTTVPRPVSLAGHRGLYLELRSPHDLSDCDDEHNDLWGHPGGRSIHGPGQVDRLWILDVAGQRIVVDAAYGDGTRAQDVSALDAMVASLRFERGGSVGR